MSCRTAVCAILPVAVAMFASVETSAAAEPPVTAIAFSPDGGSVVAGSQAGLVVRTWPTLEAERELVTDLVNIHDLAFSPDGSRLAVAGGTPSETGHVEIFDWPGGKRLHIHKTHKDTVSGIDWSAASRLASASLDHTITLWTFPENAPGQKLSGHSRGVTSLCFLPDGKTLVSAGLDQNIRVWNLADRSLIRTLNNHTRGIHDLALRPNVNGLPMVASVSDDRTVRLWQPTIGRMVRFAQLDTVPLAVEWLRDGSRVVVTGADGRLRGIDPDTVEITDDVPAVSGWAYSLAVHPIDGSLLVGGPQAQLKRITLAQ